MESVVRLVTVVDLDDGVNGPRSLSVSAVHLALLGDGRRVVLLDDRGWSESGPVDVWQRTSAEEIADTARTVVGPDEPFGDHTYADMARGHWEFLAERLRGLEGTGDEISGDGLSRLPHDVEFGPRLQERLGRP